MTPLWTIDAMADAMGAERSGTLPQSVFGLSIDTRTIVPGDAFFAIQGDNRDGHQFVSAALAAKAGVAVIAADRRGDFAADAPLLIVRDVLQRFYPAFEAMATTTRSKRPQARRTRSAWPLVIGSKVPGYRACRWVLKVSSAADDTRPHRPDRSSPQSTRPAAPAAARAPGSRDR